MKFERSRMFLVALGGCLALSACAPRLYQRETLKLDHRDLDQFEIRYAEFDGCLLRRPVPVSYRLQRSSYVLNLEVRFGNDQTAAGLEVGLSGTGTLNARFPDLGPVEPISVTDGGSRYRLDSARLGGALRVQVLRGATQLGDETITIERQRCRALSISADAPAESPDAVPAGAN